MAVRPTARLMPSRCAAARARPWVRTAARVATPPAFRYLRKIPQYSEEHVTECVEQPVVVHGTPIHFLGTTHLAPGMCRRVAEAAERIPRATGRRITAVAVEATHPNHEAVDDWEARVGSYTARELRACGCDEMTTAGLLFCHELWGGEFWKSRVLAEQLQAELVKIDVWDEVLPEELQATLLGSVTPLQVLLSASSETPTAALLRNGLGYVLDALLLRQNIHTANEQLPPDDRVSQDTVVAVAGAALGGLWPGPTGLAQPPGDLLWFAARDLLMAAKLQRVARARAPDAAACVLAVMGRGHVRGVYDFLRDGRDLGPLLHWTGPDGAAFDLFDRCLRERLGR